MKYRLLENDTINVEGRTLYRIEAVKDFCHVKNGEKGGYIESEKNLSQDDNAWVYGNARVYENAWVYGEAHVFDDSRVYGNALVGGNARVFGNAWVNSGAWAY